MIFNKNNICWTATPRFNKWLAAIKAGRQPIAQGEWVAWTGATGQRRMGRVSSAPRLAGGIYTIDLYCVDHANCLSAAGGTARVNPAAIAGGLRRLMVWLDKPETEEERPRHDGLDPSLITQHMVPRRPPRPASHRLQGYLLSSNFDPQRWVLSGWPTLGEPTTASLATVRNRHLYAMIISKKFASPEADGGGVPSSLARRGDASGPWRRYLTTVSARRPTEVTLAMRAEMRSVFTLSRTQALPLRAAQTVHRLHVCGLPTCARMDPANGRVVGGVWRAPGLCPVCLLQGVSVRETDEHRALDCTLGVLVWRAVLTAWCVVCGGQAWASSLVNGPPVLPGAPMPGDDDVRRAVVLGLRPVGQRQSK